MATPITHRVVPKNADQVRADFAALRSAVAQASTLAPGASGPQVSALQRALRGLNLYAGPVNGQFDAATEGAVRKLEGQAGQTADGIVDAAEVAAMHDRQLFVKNGFEKQARVGQKGSDILAVEQKLQKLGFHPGKVDGVFDQKLEQAVARYRKSDKSVPDAPKGIGPRVAQGLSRQVHTLEANLKKLGRNPGKVDGQYTGRTEAAVKAFQRKHHLDPTGIANARTRAAIAKAASPDRTQKFIDVAKAQVGKPYVFGADGPNAFDCSGLIHYALNKAGVNAPRLTADGYKNLYRGSSVNRANLKPGDLVFYYYPNDRGIPPGHASHIEIYLGHGKTMGTDNPSEGARVEPIDWNAFIGGARVPGLHKR